MKFWKKLNGLKTWQWSLLGASIGLLIVLIVWTSSILSFKVPYETLLPLHILSTVLIMPLVLILIFFMDFYFMVLIPGQQRGLQYLLCT